MPTIEEIIKRATAIGLPITKNAWKKTAKKPVPDPPYIIYLVSEDQRGDDNKNRMKQTKPDRQRLREKFSKKGGE